MSARPPRRLATYAAARDFSRLAYPILSKIGYELIDAGQWPVPDALPDLRLVDERRLPEVPADPEDQSVPMILLTGWRGFESQDERVIGAVRRPAGLHELYRLLQLALEETPRAVPRVSTKLQAHCSRDGVEWDATVVSLSENGCLLRSPMNPPLNAILDLRLELPEVGPLEFQAAASYQVPRRLGLVFHAMPPGFRRAIGEYVAEELANY